jgi:E3 ubiquitin-protein ligase synoviolin
MFSMVVYACVTREQFYPIILLLVSSKVSFLLISNMVFALALLLAQIMIKVFFGSLRDVEYELIMERAKYSITETCLALTIFRNDLSPSVFAFFLSLLFLKVFHWLSRSRVDYLEQVARVSLSAHTGLFLMLTMLIIIDSTICYKCILFAHAKGKTVIVLFAFEFGILVLTALNNFVRYLVNLVDGLYENGLHYKGLYFMILDLICDGLKFCTYAGFFCLVFVYYGLPIHIIR